MLNSNVLSTMVSRDCRCNELELELQKMKDHCEALETKVKTLEREKFGFEEELKVLRMSSYGFERQNFDYGEKDRVIKDDFPEDNVAVQLMIENKVLECEKIKAESEVAVWKEKYMELEGVIGRSDCDDENGKEEENKHMMITEGTPPCGIFQRSPNADSMVQPGRKVRKQLTFETEDSPNIKIAPSTPVGAKSTSGNVIIIDSDDEKGNISLSTCSGKEKGKNFDFNYAQRNEEISDFGKNLSFVETPNRKHKRRCNVVISESESDDDDDNVPISKLKKKHFQELLAEQDRPNSNSSLTATISESDTITTKRRLRPLSKCVSKSQDDKISSGGTQEVKHQQSIPTNDDDADDDESEEDSSYSEGDSINDFIVDDSDTSNCEDGSNDDVDSDSRNLQNSPYSERRKEMKWEFEGDMLAAFGKDDELCMKAVCALYRQQTCEERVIKETFCHNRRGFSKFDAHRGSTLAEFLTDGDPHGGLKKTVKELQEYNPKAVELCRSLASHYSKQLYEIYKNKEDPFFP